MYSVYVVVLWMCFGLSEAALPVGYIDVIHNTGSDYQDKGIYLPQPTQNGAFTGTGQVQWWRLFTPEGAVGADIQFQVWRPDAIYDTSLTNRFNLVGSSSWFTITRTGYSEYAETDIGVQSGDVIGYQYRGGPNPVAYTYTTSNCTEEAKVRYFPASDTFPVTTAKDFIKLTSCTKAFVQATVIMDTSRNNIQSTIPDAEDCHSRKCSCFGVQSGQPTALYSIGYNTNNYPNGESRCWIIFGQDPDDVVQLSVRAIGLEPDTDLVKIYDGTSPDDSLLRTLGSSDTIHTDPIRSSGQHMYVSFISDAIINEGGFHLDVKALSLEERQTIDWTPGKIAGVVVGVLLGLLLVALIIILLLYYFGIFNTCKYRENCCRDFCGCCSNRNRKWSLLNHGGCCQRSPKGGSGCCGPLSCVKPSCYCAPVICVNCCERKTKNRSVTKDARMKHMADGKNTKVIVVSEGKLSKREAQMIEKNRKQKEMKDPKKTAEKAKKDDEKRLIREKREEEQRKKREKKDAIQRQKDEEKRKMREQAEEQKRKDDEFKQKEQEKREQDIARKKEARRLREEEQKRQKEAKWKPNVKRAGDKQKVEAVPMGDMNSAPDRNVLSPPLTTRQVEIESPVDTHRPTGESISPLDEEEQMQRRLEEDELDEELERLVSPEKAEQERLARRNNVMAAPVVMANNVQPRNEDSKKRQDDEKKPIEEKKRHDEKEKENVKPKQNDPEKEREDTKKEEKQKPIKPEKGRENEEKEEEPKRSEPEKEEEDVQKRIANENKRKAQDRKQEIAEWRAEQERQWEEEDNRRKEQERREIEEEKRRIQEERRRREEEAEKQRKAARQKEIQQWKIAQEKQIQEEEFQKAKEEAKRARDDHKKMEDEKKRRIAEEIQRQKDEKKRLKEEEQKKKQEAKRLMKEDIPNDDPDDDEKKDKGKKKKKKKDPDINDPQEDDPTDEKPKKKKKKKPENGDDTPPEDNPKKKKKSKEEEELDELASAPPSKNTPKSFYDTSPDPDAAPGPSNADPEQDPDKPKKKKKKKKDPPITRVESDVLEDAMFYGDIIGKHLPTKKTRTPHL